MRMDVLCCALRCVLPFPPSCAAKIRDAVMEERAAVDTVAEVASIMCLHFQEDAASVRDATTRTASVIKASPAMVFLY